MALILLHTADWHLGRRFPAFPEHEHRLTRARLEVVGRILDLAENRGVDAVLCAGDLFDTPEPEEQWWRGLLQEFDRRRSWTRPVVLLPGNHDALGPGRISVYDDDHPFRRGLPGHVRVVDHAGWELPLGDGAVLVASPCISQAGQTGLAASLPRREPGDDRIRIGLLHGQTYDIETHPSNFPIPPGVAVDRGLDYLALGDTHSFRDVEPDAPAPTVYPGAPEPTRFGEGKAGNVALAFVHLDRRRRATVLPEAVGNWIWRDETCRSMAELRALRTRPDLRRTVLRLTVDMEVPLAEHDEAERILGELAGSLASTPRVGILSLDRTALRIAADAPLGLDADLPEVLLDAAERLRRRIADEKETASRALQHLYRLAREAGRP